ncbi:hypothetical protein KUL25_20720 [Rhodobacteraceae bacterium N5(2021)]|uniref:Uncharacterized protein n=1 Tax=Gymnodinialimonas phycosphaerae TaxID=2841589 RepID=A0A975TUQ5_9RHOB|nr:hypothetical protein [Gymnodinialimonas phycosphaerae]MBY4895193.1 hypothetical protein [Gymnodinialimonas phycosphaerae]
MHALLYRLFRLRRLICVAILLPMLSVAIVYLLKGPVALALAPIAVLVPVAHVLWYPNARMETLPVSISLSFVLILGGMIGPDVGLVGLALRLAGIAVLGGLLVLAFSTVLIRCDFSGTGATDHDPRAALVAAVASGVEAGGDALPRTRGRQDHLRACQ